jgi:hypothetical protein
MPLGRDNECSHCVAAQAEKEDATSPGHSLIFISTFFWIFFPKKSRDARRTPCSRSKQTLTPTTPEHTGYRQLIHTNSYTYTLVYTLATH